MKTIIIRTTPKIKYAVIDKTLYINLSWLFPINRIYKGLKILRRKTR
jgi:hypothetical protein